METADKKNNEVVAKINIEMLNKTDISHSANVAIEGSGQDILQLYSDLTGHLLKLGLPEGVLTEAFKVGCLSADKKKLVGGQF